MTYLKEILKKITSQLEGVMSKDEAKAVSFLLLENYLDTSKPSILANLQVVISTQAQDQLDEAINRLLNYEPIQYVLGKASFFGREFTVSPSVLIPRPETEELVSLILRDSGGKKKILDVGTGSGAIAITLEQELDCVEVYAIDIDPEAIKVAETNAQRLGANIRIQHTDFLKTLPDVTGFDIMVSNPPYVTEGEKHMMNKNVLDFEPDIALFVPENDPLIFYKRMLEVYPYLLQPKGRIYAEINESKGLELKELFEKSGLADVSIIRDIHGKDRFIKAVFNL